MELCISCALSNMNELTVCTGYLFVFGTALNRITIMLLFDFISCYLVRMIFFYFISYFVRMKFQRLVLKINLHTFVKVWQYPKLSYVINFSSTLTIMLCNRGVSRGEGCTCTRYYLHCKNLMICNFRRHLGDEK